MNHVPDMQDTFSFISKFKVCKNDTKAGVPCRTEYQHATNISIDAVQHNAHQHTVRGSTINVHNLLINIEYSGII